MGKITKISLAALVTLSTSAFAGEVSKIEGQAKFWYETGMQNSSTSTQSLFDRSSVSNVIVYTGAEIKQDDVKFSVRLNGMNTSTVSSSHRTMTGGGFWVDEAVVTFPCAVPDTSMMAGRMALKTPFAYTENWDARRNTFDAMVIVNNSIKDLTLVGAWVGTGNGATYNATPETYTTINGDDGVFAVVAHSKLGGINANGYYYNIPSQTTGNSATHAGWADAVIPVAGINIKVIGATMMPDSKISNSNYAVAASADLDVAGLKVMAAGSMTTAAGTFGNLATGGKKTWLPTAGVYNDGLYVAQADVMAAKVKVSGLDVAGIKLAAQYSMAMAGTNKYSVNGATAADTRNDKAKDNSELDIIASTKVNKIDLKAIYMLRMGANYNSAVTAGTDSGTANASSLNTAASDTSMQQRIRVVASVNF
jgi:hypothetical protein